MILFSWILTFGALQCTTNASGKTVKRLVPVNHWSDPTSSKAHPTTPKVRHHPMCYEHKFRQSLQEYADSNLRRVFRIMGPMMPDPEDESRTTTSAPRTRWRGYYVSQASWKTPCSAGSSNEWQSMHKNVNLEYSHEWYEFIYSTEESNPYYAYSYQRTSCFWLKIRNTRSTPEPYRRWKTELLHNRSRFEKRKRERAHEEWKMRNQPVSISDEDCDRYLRRVLFPHEVEKNRTRDLTVPVQSGKNTTDTSMVDSVDKEYVSGAPKLREEDLLDYFWTHNGRSENST